MKLWDKGYSVNDLVNQFTTGNDQLLDLKLAKYDVLGSIAHVKMLNQIQLITDKELPIIVAELENILTEIEEGKFTIEAEFEDVHSKVEHELVKRIGESGKKIHSARSRNDQVLVDLHLYTKAEIVAVKSMIKEVFNTLLELSEKHKNVLIPGYTHMQVAMPSSFGLWFSAYAETFIDDLIILNAAYKIADQNPLGSAAGYGSSFPINRQMTTDLLDFDTMKYNVVAAQLSRGRLEKSTAFALASVASTISKLSADVCLYMSQNFNFISFPKELTTGSSIMPHKKNPDVFELLRAKSNKVQNLPAEIQSITNNLTSGYHRDFQLLKESYLAGFDTIKENLYMLNFMMQHIEVNPKAVDDSIYDYMYSVEAVNQLVLDGMTFRDAYKTLGQQLLSGDFTPPKEVNHTHEGSIGNLCLNEIKSKFKTHFEL